MSLTTRLLVFFQTTLAIVLLIFCSTLDIVAGWYVHHLANDTAERSIATLVASVDIEPDSVEWEPSDRDVSLGLGPLGGEISWYITDVRGNLVDQSQGADELLTAAGTDRDPPAAEGWISSRRLVHPPGATETMLTRARTQEEIEKGEYPALVFTTGVKTGPLRSALNTLAAGLAGLALAIWLVTFSLGRWMCRRALRPVTQMAEAARLMRAEDTDTRLPLPGARGELEELHAAINGLLARLHATLERERRFTAEASHQLRTPLGTILGQVEVALRRPRSQEEYERVLGVVQRQTADLTHSVEALLYLARSEADAPPPQMEPIDLREWLPAFVATLTTRPRHEDISFETELASPVRIAAHAPLLRELVENLIDNALKYSPPGTPVVVRVGIEVGDAVLTVEDRGPGIAETDLPHIFEPFFRAGDAGGVPGSGLGLAIVARITAAFGGQVAVEDRPGGGTRFTVRLPARVDEENFITASRTH